MGEIKFAGDVPAAKLSRLVSRGDARRLGRGIYARDVRSNPERVVTDNWQEIVAHVYPGAVVVDRSVAAPGLVGGGYLYLDVGPKGSIRTLSLPGLTVVARRGPGPIEDDMALRSDGSLHLSSVARGLVDNARPTRTTKHRPRPTLDALGLADWVETIVADQGPDRVRRWRTRAREIAAEYDLETEYEAVDELVGASLGTRKVTTGSPRLRARQAGRAYDRNCMGRLETLAEALHDRAPASLPALAVDAERRSLLPFFEAYFSNFIEGTEFAVEEARRIILDGVDPPDRPADAHDIRSAYEIVADLEEMSRTPSGGGELIEILKERHSRILAVRPEMRPGLFKDVPNRSGSVTFVAPELVDGTLRAGWDLLDDLADPFHRAVFVMFHIVEVHPFDDGNGRVARIMMNAELVTAAETRIIIPTGLRANYLSALTALTMNDRPGALIRVLDFAQRYTAQIDFSTEESASQQLEETNAFRTSDEVAQYNYRLLLPSDARRDD